MAGKMLPAGHPPDGSFHKWYAYAHSATTAAATTG
jgi:hypothetical protein